MCGAQVDVLASLATRALEFVRDGAVVGLGTGRAATVFLRALADRVRQGLAIKGVPTSEETARLARELNIPLVGLDEGPIHVTVDGADEVDPQLNLIKGYGGALVRERIVAAASRMQVILVDNSKLVPMLGTRGRLPVEVIPFAVPLCVGRLKELGCQPTVRLVEGKPFVSDNGNAILDCAIGPLEAPAAFDNTIRIIPGVVDTGMFLGTAHTVLVAEGGTVREL
ncbi:MAG: ribose-5-phosphate isomerase RpiA, partial [Candidatus Methylomirabilales bacterium]